MKHSQISGSAALTRGLHDPENYYVFWATNLHSSTVWWKKNPQTLTNANTNDTNCLTSDCSAVGQSFRHALVQSKSLGVSSGTRLEWWEKTQTLLQLRLNLAKKKTCIKSTVCVASFPARSFTPHEFKMIWKHRRHSTLSVYRRVGPAFCPFSD